MRQVIPIALVLLAVTGCTVCHHRAGDLALEDSRCPEIPACQRMNTVAILVKGFDPLDIAGVEPLRTALIESGFPKVFRIESHHAAFIEREIRQILCENPETRIVLVGSGTGAMLARSLSRTLARSGAHVDSVIEIAPVFPSLLGAGYDLDESMRHIVIGNVGQCLTDSSQHTEYRVVSGLSRFLPCANPLVVEMVKDEMKNSSRNVITIESAGPTLPIIDNPAPIPGLIGLQH